MDISEIRVKLVENPRERLLAFCTVTFRREFVVRDVKIIDGPRGPFVAMPSRKVMDRCKRCGGKNHLRSSFCNECGGALDRDRAPKDARGRPRLHVDVAHPINQDCRSNLESQVIASYHEELERASQPGYVAPDLEDNLDDYVFEVESVPGVNAVEKRGAADKPAGRSVEAGGESHFQAE